MRDERKKRRLSSLKQDLHRYYTSSEECVEWSHIGGSTDSEDRMHLAEFIPEGATVIDLACGPADMGRRISGKAFYVGTDLSLPGLRKAQENGLPNTAFARADVERLPYGTNSADVVMSTYAIEHFVHVESALRDMVRVVAPDGYVIILAPSWDMPHQLPPSVVLNSGLARLLFIARRLLRQLYYEVRRRKYYFEVLDKVARFEGGKRRVDDDATYLVCSYQLARFLRLNGMEIIYQKRSNKLDTPGRLKRFIFRILMFLPCYRAGYPNTYIIARKPNSSRGDNR